MAVAHLLPEPHPESPSRGLAPIIPLRPEQRMAADEARSRWDRLVADAYGEHRMLVFAEALRILRREDLAEDVVQEVFARLWSRPGSFDPERGCLRAYLRTVARGRSIDLLRSEVNRRARQDRVSCSPSPRADIASAVVESEALTAALRRLPAHEREVVALAYLEDRTYREVADRLGIPEGTVKTRMRSAFSRLRETITA